MATKKKPEIVKKKCTRCSKEKHMVNEFYSSKNSMFADGRVPICKKCLIEMVDENDIESVKRVLRQIDKPFIWSRWKKALESEKETFGWYIREINSFLPDATYDDSVSDVTDAEYREVATGEVNIEDIEEIETDTGDSIKVTKEIKLKFGSGYSNAEYLEMEKFYQDMITSHDINTPQHKSMLVEICLLNIEKKRLLQEKNFDKYKKVADAYKNLIADSGFRPADRVAGNESQGIRTFSQIYEEIEKDGFIEPPDLKETQDIVDRTIQYMLNYTLKLLNMEQLSEPPSDTPKVEEEDDYYEET